MPTVPQITPEIQAAVESYFATKPEQREVFERDYGGDLATWLNAFTSFWDTNGNAVEDLGPYAPEMGLIDALGFKPTPSGPATPGGANSTPIDQAIFNEAVPRLIGDVNADAGRRDIANGLATQVLGAGGALGNALARTQGGGFDGRTYLEQNQDVAAEYQRQLAAGQTTLTPAQFAEKHYLEFGQREGRQPAYIQSAQLAQDFNNANTITASNIAAGNAAFATNLGALQTATTALQANLTGAMADKAAALNTLVTTLNANLDQLDATQRKALTDQIAAMQANLTESIGAQKAALAEQLAALGTAATTEAQARRDALQTEIASLTAAQAPLAEARLGAAELQATAVNLGLERTKDQLTAEAARDGFVGGSTVQDAALVRATVDARQRAAEATAGARVANAGDTRDIAVRGATGTRSIADALAEANRADARMGAKGNFDLATQLARGRQGLGDAGASGQAAITSQTAQTRYGIGDRGATIGFQDKVAGADEKRSIFDALAKGTFGLTQQNAANTLAAQQQGNAAKATYYDNDYNRSIGGALSAVALPGQITNTLTGLDNYANSGLTRSLGMLQWWATPTGAAPTPNYTPVQPSNSGNDLANLGAGLFRLGGSIGQANNWGAGSSAPQSTVLRAPDSAGNTMTPYVVSGNGGSGFWSNLFGKG